MNEPGKQIDSYIKDPSLLSSYAMMSLTGSTPCLVTPSSGRSMLNCERSHGRSKSWRRRE